MSATSWRFVREWARATIPRRWRGLVAVAAVIGVLAAVSMGSLAAARRTQSAFPAYLSGSHASSVQVYVYDAQTPNGNSTANNLTARLARLRGVSHVAAAPYLFLVPTTRQGRQAMQANVMVLGSIGGAYFRSDRPVLVSGTMPSPSDPRAVVASVVAARLLGWHVGERIALDAYTLHQALGGSTYPPVSPPAGHVTVTLRGLVTFASEVAHDDVDKYPVYVLATPALTRSIPRSQGYSSYLLTLDRGDAGAPQAEREVVGALPAFSVYEFHVTSVVAGQVERAIRPESIALATFAGIAALATLLIGAQAVRRQVAAQREGLAVARALGADRATLVVAASVGPLSAVLVGAAVSVGVAIAVSPIAPVGAVRAIDPSPGVAVDATVLLAGVAVLCAVLGGLAVTFAVSAVRQRDRAAGLWARSRLAEAAARGGLPAPGVAGIRFSLERGAQRSATSVYSVLVASVLAVVVAVATVTFASSLSTLSSTPSLYGWNWDRAIISTSGSVIPPAVGRLLSDDRQVSGWASYGYAVAQIQGVSVPLLLDAARHDLATSLLSGHALEGPHQIVLGAETAAQLHAHLGSTLVASYGTRRSYPIWVRPTKVTVVGIATMPTLGNTNNLHTSMGVGAELSTLVEPPAMRAALHQRDVNLDGPQAYVARFRRGVPAAAGVAGLERIAQEAANIMARDPLGGPQNYAVIAAQRPAEIVIYQSTGATPALLAIALGAGVVVALAMALASSVRRRRRDLALLKTLGFTRRQLAATIAAQATVVAVVGVLFGVPIGIALGRWLWIRFAETIAAVPEPTVPTGAVVAIAVAALVLANLVAALPGRAAARTPAALVLRSE